MKESKPLLGLEMEMVVAHGRTGASLALERYGEAMLALKRDRGVSCEAHYLANRLVSVRTASADCGYDNGFNLLETALDPVDGGRGGLARLAAAAFGELADSQRALMADEACILNASQHPNGRRDAQWYAQACVPRAIYRELRNHRGWRHEEGLDAKAQNGANTSVPVSRVISALNVVLALAPASIALFANSPLESGRHEGYKERRMTMWPRMFGPARFAGDLRLCTYPRRPFRDLADYFHWMFGPGTVSRGLPVQPGDDYKGADVILPEGEPCLYDMLRAGRWAGRALTDGRRRELRLQAGHFVFSQIGQFLDGRLRYHLGTPPSLSELMAAWGRDGGLESLFLSCGARMYIEARAPGAGFADACLLAEGGAAVARSLLLAPAAMQLGLLNNLDQAERLVRQWGWRALGCLRQPAMRAGVADAGVHQLCMQALSVARDGLDPEDRSWLDYPAFVLETGRTGADRLLATWDAAQGGPLQRQAALLHRHRALAPRAYGGCAA